MTETNSQTSAPPQLSDKTIEAKRLTHLRSDGSAHMVDVTEKPVSMRLATAIAVFNTTPEVVTLLTECALPKGVAFGTARIAGILAAKRTHELIPLCHPLPLTSVAVDFEVAEASVTVLASVTTKGVTGVEMEALTAANIAALTLYDMTKAVHKGATISDIRVLSKSGGMSGDWVADEH